MSSDIMRWLAGLDARIARLETAETITPGSPGGAHSVLSATHTDSLAAAVVAGDLFIGNDTPKWSRLGITVPAAGTQNYLGVSNAETKPSWKSASAAPGAAAAVLASNATGGLTLAGKLSYNEADWTGGNVVYVPLGGDIQAYVNAAAAGDTLVLASGQYVITSTITVAKQLNIVGQGNAGFLTSPVTASHGTLISSVTNAIVAFQIDSDNVRIANLSVNLTGNASTGINTANNLKGLVFTNIDVIVTCVGLAQGFTIWGSNCVLRDLTFYITSTNTAASGFWFWNDSSTTQNAIADCYNVTGTVKGAGSYAYGYVCENINDANTLTLNLESCTVRSLTGTPLDVAVASISTTTNNSTVNCFLCTLDGADYDAYQTGSNVLALGGSVLVNNLVFGTVTYRAALAAGLGVFSGAVTAQNFTATDFTASTAVYADATKKLVSLANGTGCLYDNGAGAFSWVPTSYNPGAASALLKTDASGYFSVLRIGLGVYPPTESLDVNGNAYVHGGNLFLGPVGVGAGDTGHLEFRELVANGTDVVGFKAPDAIAADVIWTLPGVDGSAGQSLVTSGAGVLSWAAPAPGAHSLLSASHGDTLTGSVVQGDLLMGNATPKWARLAKGSANAFLRTDGTDVLWSTGFLAVTAAKTLTVQNSLTLSGTDAKALTLTGSLTVGADASITGGGTLALASFTLTVPATGTAALGTGTATLLATWNTANTLQAGPANAAGYLKNNGAGVLSWDAGTTAAHNLLSATHSDALADSVVEGDLLVGNATPKWARLAFAYTGLVNYVGCYDSELGPSWKAATSNPGAYPRMLASSASGYLQLVRLGAGVAPSYPLHALATTTQLRLDYDSSNHAAFAVGSAGLLTITPVDEVKVAANANDWKGLEAGNANAGTTAAGRVRVTSDRTAAQSQVMMGLFGSGNTQTYFGLTMADYAALITSGSVSNGLIIGTATADSLILGTNNVVRATITGTGDTTFSGSKIGFLGAAAVAQAAHIADATNAADVITRVNAILVVLENLGFVALS